MARLDKAQTSAVTLAKRDLGRLWAEIEDLPPAQQRDILLDMLPAIAARYGDVSSTAAAEWYQGLWDALYTGQWEATPVANPLSDEDARRIIRANAGLLWKPGTSDSTDNPMAFLQWANAFLDRNVKAGGRLTIRANTSRDPHKPRFARVPSGVNVCMFCIMLAGRGAVYASAETAAGHDYHPDCHCEPVPEWGPHGLDGIEGYDPDQYSAVYEDARRMLEHPDSMDTDMRAAVMAGDTYTVNITQPNGRIRHVTYDTGDPNNLNALAMVARRMHPELFN